MKNFIAAGIAAINTKAAIANHSDVIGWQMWQSEISPLLERDRQSCHAIAGALPDFPGVPPKVEEYRRINIGMINIELLTSCIGSNLHLGIPETKAFADKR